MNFIKLIQKDNIYVDNNINKFKLIKCISDIIYNILFLIISSMVLFIGRYIILSDKTMIGYEKGTELSIYILIISTLIVFIVNMYFNIKNLLNLILVERVK